LPEPRRTVLVTRPEPGAGETAARLERAGFVPILAPMLDIRPLAAPPPPPADAILLTSRNGLLGLPPGPITAPVFAVGRATERAARARGATAVAGADGNAEDLAALIRARLPAGSTLLLPAAAGQGGALAAALRAAGYAVHLHPCYEARPADTLPEPARAALAAGRIAAALFFSAETARAFVRAVRRAGLETATEPVTACAISPAVTVALEPLVWRHVRVAGRPNQEALLALLA